MVNDSLESAHAAVLGLVDSFSANEAYYCSSVYSEAQARVSFIDQFWMALGWDVHHEHQKNPYAQEVKVEDPQKIEGSSRRADYAFFTAPDFQHPRFFCEAKKPSVQLKTDADAAFQTLRYGKSADTPLAVLTDFEEVHILDCRVKPDIDTALARCHRRFRYTDWRKPDTFAEFYWLFSREAFSSGGFDAYVAALSKPQKVGTQLGLLRAGSQPVGEDFLADLEAHRRTLAELLKTADPSLDGDGLTELVQRILDRLIFLRFLEDKLIETDYQVQDFSRAAGGHAWNKFLAACRKLDTRYNGIVFKHHPLLDTPGRLPIDESSFADLCEHLSYTKSPYNLHYIPVHILGSIYERFLGKIITDQGGVEDKPEVRKAGGVYYTPEYIVRYICEATVGRQVEGKTPAQIAKMRFADIACGSGSFLLEVYDLLIRAHGLWYNAHPDEAKKENLAPPDKGKKRRRETIPAVVEHEGVLRLTLEKKREILLNSVFGVDLDPQAVEVAQLSLYLKLLEDETTASARQHYLDFHEALLPPLKNNVVRGNSLVSTDILFGQFEFSAKEERKLAPMDFQSAFPAVMKEGGFNAIIGNPPYRRERDFKYLLDQIAACNFGKEFRVARMDLWYYFVHRALRLLTRDGVFSYIVNAYWTNSTGATKLITDLKSNATLEEIYLLGKLKIFENVAGQHMIIRASLPASTKKVKFKKAIRIDENSAEPFFNKKSSPLIYTKTHAEVFCSGQLDVEQGARGPLEKLELFPPLSSLGQIRQGIAENPASVNRKTCARLKSSWTVGAGVFALTPNELAALQLSKAEMTIVRPYHDLCDIGRYSLLQPSLRLIYSTRVSWPKRDDFPKLRDHLTPYRKIMDGRRETLSGSNQWWHLHWPREEAIWKADKILSVQMGHRPAFVTAHGETYVSFSVNVIVLKPKTSLSLNYFLGLLNSQLLFEWFKRNAKKRGANLEINGNVLQRVPIRTLDLSKPAEKKQHDRMVQLVEAILTAQQQIAAAGNETDRVYYESKAAGLDRQIDELTFDLYGLTSAERLVFAGN